MCCREQEGEGVGGGGKTIAVFSWEKQRKGEGSCRHLVARDTLLPVLLQHGSEVMQLFNACG